MDIKEIAMDYVLKNFPHDDGLDHPREEEVKIITGLLGRIASLEGVIASRNCNPTENGDE